MAPEDDKEHDLELQRVKQALKGLQNKCKNKNVCRDNSEPDPVNDSLSFSFGNRVIKQEILTSEESDLSSKNNISNSCPSTKTPASTSVDQLNAAASEIKIEKPSDSEDDDVIFLEKTEKSNADEGSETIAIPNVVETKTVPLNSAVEIILSDDEEPVQAVNENLRRSGRKRKKIVYCVSHAV